MTHKLLFSLLASCSLLMPASAQNEVNAEKTATLKAFNNLEVGVNVGSTGIGFDFATYVHNSVRVRTGFDFMPQFKPTLNFHITSGQYDEEGNWIESNFDDMADRLESFTGYRADNIVGMKGKPTFTNFKMLVDVFPFKNKKWHITAGFYLGSSVVARAYNKTEEMASLLALGIYNNLYDKILNGEPIYGDNLYLDPEIENKVLEFGRMGIFVGNRGSDGSAYMMEPDKDGMVKAKIKVNSFRPYLGFGYGGRLIKDNDKYNVSFDCGAMFWGGTPKILTHDGTDLAKDITDFYGDVGNYVDVIKKFKVYPVLNLRMSYRLY